MKAFEPSPRAMPMKFCHAGNIRVGHDAVRCFCHAARTSGEGVVCHPAEREKY